MCRGITRIACNRRRARAVGLVHPARTWVLLLLDLVHAGTWAGSRTKGLRNLRRRLPQESQNDIPGSRLLREVILRDKSCRGREKLFFRMEDLGRQKSENIVLFRDGWRQMGFMPFGSKSFSMCLLLHPRTLVDLMKDSNRRIWLLKYGTGYISFHLLMSTKLRRL